MLCLWCVCVCWGVWVGVGRCMAHGCVLGPDPRGLCQVMLHVWDKYRGRERKAPLQAIASPSWEEVFGFHP